MKTKTKTITKTNINKLYFYSLPYSPLSSPLSACTPPTPPEAPDTVIETTSSEDDKFKVSVDVSQIDKNDKNESLGNLENDKDGGDLGSPDETKGDDRPAWEIEESMAESQRAEAEEEESKAYEEYINSEEEYEIYMAYDRTEGDTLIFSEEVAMSDENPDDIRTFTIRVPKSVVSGDIEDLSKGDMALILYNGAQITDENNPNNSELIKVYSITNQTAIERAEDESYAAEERAELEKIAKEEGISVEEYQRLYGEEEGKVHHSENPEE